MSLKNKHEENPNLITPPQIQPVLIGMALFLGLMIGGLVVYAIDLVDNDNYNNSANQEVLGSSSYYDQEYLQDVVDTINSKYLGETDGLTKDAITYGLVKGLVNSLGDKYTFFLNPEEAEAYFSQAAGDFEGIGVVLSFNGQYAYIETVLKDQPAQLAGVQAGDIILEVDGEDVSDMLPAVVAQKIRGEKDTKVTLKLYRAEDTASAQLDEIDITITRNRIEVDNITWAKENDNTVTINISQFSDKDLQTFIGNWDNVVAEIQAEAPNVENIIVDLRNNPGGYVAGVNYILEEFLENGEIVMKERTKNQEEKVYKDSRKGQFENKNLIVLVNESSASASEIFAAAIQDNDKGKVVGEKTVGKGVEQELQQFGDGGILFLVFQEWLTPDGRRITPENPITPDYEVEYNLDNFKNNTDPQMDKALELLK